MKQTFNTTRAGDEYRVTLIALGPGLICCVVRAFILGDVERLPLAGPLVYSGFLLVSFPGLPVTGYLIGRFLPRYGSELGAVGRLTGLIAAPILSVWHLMVIDISAWAVEGGSFFLAGAWSFIIGYSVCLNTVTMVVWGFIVWLRRRRELK